MILDLTATAYGEIEILFAHNDATVFERANADEALHNPGNAANSTSSQGPGYI